MKKIETAARALLAICLVCNGAPYRASARTSDRTEIGYSESVRSQKAGASSPQPDSQYCPDFDDFNARQHVREWNYLSVRSRLTSVLRTAMMLVEWDKPECTLKMIPTGMNIQQFHNMLLREMDRRNRLTEYVLWFIMMGHHDSWEDNYDLNLHDNIILSNNLDRIFQFERPTQNWMSYSVSTGIKVKSDITPGEAMLYDAALTSVYFERYSYKSDNGSMVYPDLVLDSDVVSALNLPQLPKGEYYAYGMNLTDVMRRTLGYAFASVDRFNPELSKSSLTVSLQLKREDGSPVYASEMQDQYCRQSRALYEAGASMNPRDAFLSGFVQGRVNRKNPGATSPAIGITGACPD